MVYSLRGMTFELESTQYAPTNTAFLRGDNLLLEILGIVHTVPFAKGFPVVRSRPYSAIKRRDRVTAPTLFY